MNWEYYFIFSWIAIISWITSAIIVWWYNLSKFISRISDVLIITGIISLALFITLFWISLERPPLRTLGETRLWYALFLPVIGFVVLKKWKYAWFASYSLLMGLVFLFINLLKPEIHDKTLMPALQSIWFVPHVIVYIAGYSFLGASALIAVVGLYFIYFKSEKKVFLFAR